jgi:predicted nucleic acid-binding protein
VNAYVVDASVAAKWFLEEDHTAQARAILGSKAPLHAPDFLLLELDNVFWKRIRRGDMTPENAHEARSILRQLPIHLHAFEALRDAAFSIAQETNRTVYDSLYVALAIVLGSAVVTADRGLYDILVNGPYGAAALWVGDLSARQDHTSFAGEEP